MKQNRTDNFILVTGLLLAGAFLCVTLVFALSPLLFPQTASDESATLQVRTERSGEEAVTLPVRIVIPAVGVDASIETPVSTDIRVLDGALTRGAVHYPGSGTPGNGNMFIFGHSTSLTNVINQAYQTFNDVQHLEKGDEIIVYAGGEKHWYVVESVALVSADEALVDFSTSKDMLTLSTCNTFGAKQERFVVEAMYEGSARF